jgi:uncharacterized protein (TIGR01777 family)
LNLLITGAQGFVGSKLSDALLSRSHHIVALGRSAQASRSHDRYDYISADTTRPGKWLTALKDVDAVINLTGESIFKRWTDKTKQRIYDSRVLTTRLLAENLPRSKSIPLLSASGVGFYGSRGSDELTENEPAGDDFLAALSIDWEAAALSAADKGHRVVCMRFGIVLGKDGGALATMASTFRRFTGGRLGSGQQWFPWMHIDDLVGAILFALQHDDFSGPVNFCSPHPVTNNELTRELASVLGRPALLPAPGFLLRMAMGEFANVLLGSQRALPDRLSRAGFQFRHPNLRGALDDLLTD